MKKWIKCLQNWLLNKKRKYVKVVFIYDDGNGVCYSCYDGDFFNTLEAQEEIKEEMKDYNSVIVTNVIEISKEEYDQSAYVPYKII